MEYKMLGVNVEDFDMDSILEFISKTIDESAKTVIVSQNFHGIYTLYRSSVPEVAGLHEISKKRIDGMPLVWLGKLLGYPLDRKNRLTWVDLMFPLMERASSNGHSIFYLGADESSVSQGVSKLKSRFPLLKIAYRNGFFNVTRNSESNKNVITLINEFRPDILIVGMGMPRQEKWIYQNIDALNTHVIMTCGAAIEYVAGTVKTPPRWMGNMGLEWLFRFSENPRRFWYRYMVEPWFVFLLAGKDLTNRYIMRREL